MKKHLPLLWICGVCLGLLLYNIFYTPIKTAQMTPDSTAPTSTAATTHSKDGEGDSIPEPDGEETNTPAVQVRILNQDGNRQAWRAIAKQYSEKTGVEVLILEADSELSPTLLTARDPQELEGLTVHDLSGTVAYAQLANMNLTLSVEGKVCGIAAEMNAFGMIYNTDLLIGAGYTPEVISDLASFSTVVQGLAQQGYTAFAGRSLQDGVAEKLLSLPGNVRTLAGLWLNHTVTGSQENGLERFMNGESVFYMGSTDEYDAITAGSAKNLGILPVYLDDQTSQAQSLCVTAERYWCVVGEDEAETAATMAFLNYLVTQDENGAVPVDSLEMLAPYRQATWFSNPLEQILRQDLTAGKGYLVCRQVTEVPEGFVDALIAYAQDPTDENWALVEANKM